MIFVSLCPMSREHVILYIHGMGGGGDSRIPSILREYFTSPGYMSSNQHADSVDVCCRTYSFDPEIAHLQIESWVKELQPDLVIGESLGSLHALRIPDIPSLFVSPALNAPIYFQLMAWLSLIPGMTWMFDRIYKPKDGDRQSLHFTFSLLRKYLSHRKAAISACDNPSAFTRRIHAFFGTEDYYRRSGVVSVKTWKKHFGDTFSTYKGTHFMEEEYIISALIPCICNVLSTKK